MRDNLLCAPSPGTETKAAPHPDTRTSGTCQLRKPTHCPPHAQLVWGSSMPVGIAGTPQVPKGPQTSPLNLLWGHQAAPPGTHDKPKQRIVPNFNTTLWQQRGSSRELGHVNITSGTSKGCHSALNTTPQSTDSLRAPYPTSRVRSATLPCNKRDTQSKTSQRVSLLTIHAKLPTMRFVSQACPRRHPQQHTAQQCPSFPLYYIYISRTMNTKQTQLVGKLLTPAASVRTTCH